MTKRRCKVTGNPCGTDTWPLLAPCKCVECQAFVSESHADAVQQMNAAVAENAKLREMLRQMAEDDGKCPHCGNEVSHTGAPTVDSRLVDAIDDALNHHAGAGDALRIPRWKSERVAALVNELTCRWVNVWRERGYYEYWCTVCGTTNNSSTVHAGTAYDGGEHCGKPMRCTRWVPVVAQEAQPLDAQERFEP